MCQIRAHVHQPCGCKSHQLRVCSSYKTQACVPTIASNNTNIDTATGSISSFINPRTVPRFITICSKTFSPDIFSACPSYNVHPEVIDPHPCSDHWTMLSDIRLLFGPPRGLDRGNDDREDEGGNGKEAVIADDDGGGAVGGQRWQLCLSDIEADGDCPDPVRKNHFDSLRERYCQVMSGDRNGKSGLGVDVAAGVCQQQSQTRPERRTSCKLPGVTKAKGGLMFLGIFLEWMGS